MIDFDVNAHGEMLPWVIARLRARLPEMLTEAGGAQLIDQLDGALVKRTIDDVAAMAEAAQRVHCAAAGR